MEVFKKRGSKAASREREQVSECWRMERISFGQDKRAMKAPSVLFPLPYNICMIWWISDRSFEERILPSRAITGIPLPFRGEWVSLQDPPTVTYSPRIRDRTPVYNCSWTTWRNVATRCVCHLLGHLSTINKGISSNMDGHSPSLSSTPWSSSPPPKLGESQQEGWNWGLSRQVRTQTDKVFSSPINLKWKPKSEQWNSHPRFPFHFANQHEETGREKELDLEF